MDLRNTLLLAQILHSNGVLTVDQLNAALDADINVWIYRLSHHKSNQLNGDPIEGLATKGDLIELFKLKLAEWEASTLEELANKAYFKRIEELETKLVLDQDEFTRLLS